MASCLEREQGRACARDAHRDARRRGALEHLAPPRARAPAGRPGAAGPAALAATSSDGSSRERLDHQRRVRGVEDRRPSRGTTVRQAPRAPRRWTARSSRHESDGPQVRVRVEPAHGPVRQRDREPAEARRRRVVGMALDLPAARANTERDRRSARTRASGRARADHAGHRRGRGRAEPALERDPVDAVQSRTAGELAAGRRRDAIVVADQVGAVGRQARPRLPPPT